MVDDDEIAGKLRQMREETEETGRRCSKGMAEDGEVGHCALQLAGEKDPYEEA